MAPARFRPSDLGHHLPKQGLIWWHGCSGESALLRAELAQADQHGLECTGIFVPGLNRLDTLLSAGIAVQSFFMLPELASKPAQTRFLPLCYRDIGRELQRRPPAAAIFMVSPPDADGRCSFGTVTDFLADIWRSIPIRIAHINPLMPATRGEHGIPFDELTAYTEAPEQLLESDPGIDAVAKRIAVLAAEAITDGATIQAGLGRMPEAVLRALTSHRDLAIHSGLIGDSTLDLLEAGALRAEAPVTAGVAIGTRRLYDAVSGAAFRFQSPSYTHDIRVLSTLKRFTTINSAIEVDLLGQAYAEATPKGLISGPGGASDFAAGARGKDSLRLMVLPATAGKASRIIRPEQARGPVSLGRFDIEMVVTEHGAADLRGLSHRGRAEALIAIAAPEFQADLGAYLSGPAIS
jgi:acyl-CoA hydrolase